MALPYAMLYGQFARKPRVRILIRHKDNILLVKNWIGMQSWSLPGGGIDRDESSLEAAHREVKEEVGIILAKDPTPTLIAPSPEPTTLFRIQLFDIELKKKPQVTIDELEIIEYRWVNLKDLEAVANPKLHQLIQIVMERSGEVPKYSK